MFRKVSTIVLLLFLSLVFSSSVFAAKVPAPATAGDGFKMVTLAEAEKLFKDGAVFIACHSHTTDFMKGHPDGTIHVTCMVPKDHKSTDFSIDKVVFDMSLLPKDKKTPLIFYCASNK